jgi:hypothetical protein
MGLITANPNFQDAAVLGATIDDDDGGSIVGLSSATDADGGVIPRVMTRNSAAKTANDHHQVSDSQRL